MVSGPLSLPPSGVLRYAMLSIYAEHSGFLARTYIYTHANLITIYHSNDLPSRLPGPLLRLLRRDRRRLGQDPPGRVRPGAGGRDAVGVQAPAGAELHVDGDAAGVAQGRRVYPTVRFLDVARACPAYLGYCTSY